MGGGGIYDFKIIGIYYVWMNYEFENIIRNSINRL